MTFSVVGAWSDAEMRTAETPAVNRVLRKASSPRDRLLVSHKGKFLSDFPVEYRAGYLLQSNVAWVPRRRRQRQLDFARLLCP
jgi:hypothetical protein